MATMRTRALTAGVVALAAVGAVVVALHVAGKAEGGGPLGPGPVIAAVKRGRDLMLGGGHAWVAVLARAGKSDEKRSKQTLWGVSNGGLLPVRNGSPRGGV